MTSHMSYTPQDFHKMCEQAERNYESKKLMVLLDRVKKQIAARENPTLIAEAPKPPVAVLSSDSGRLRAPSRTALFER
jgi:hypothetical protein